MTRGSRVEADLPHHTVKGWIERFPPAIHQFEEHGIASRLPALKPERGLLVHQKAVTVHRHPQPPAGVIGPQVLQGSIDQEPIEQHRFPGVGLPGTHRQQLGTSLSGQSEGIGRDPMQPDLAKGPGRLHHFAPGTHCIDREPVAARAEGRHGGGGLQQGLGKAVIKLHHQMGSKPKGSRIH